MVSGTNKLSNTDRKENTPVTWSQAAVSFGIMVATGYSFLFILSLIAEVYIK